MNGSKELLSRLPATACCRHYLRDLCEFPEQCTVWLCLVREHAVVCDRLPCTANNWIADFLGSREGPEGYRGRLAVVPQKFFHIHFFL